MVYKFKSPVAADLIMLGSHGDQFLQLIGKVPSSQGIVEAARLPEAIEAVRAAMALDDARRAAQAADNEDTRNPETSPDRSADDAVTLRQRMSPMVLMMSTALAEDEDIVWGV